MEKRPHVLLVEPSLSLGAEHADWLTRAGYSVARWRGPGHPVEGPLVRGHALVLAERPDVVVLDVELGAPSDKVLGLSALERYIEHGLVVLVLATTPSDVEPGMGSATVLRKPVGRTALLETVAGLASGRVLVSA
jgi:DNA-binding response OmpR family regulator